MSTSKTDELAIAGRYATAIFALAAEAKKLDAVIGEISGLAAAVTENAELRSALSNPLVSRAQKQAVLEALLGKAAPLTQRAVAMIAEGGRADLLPAIAEVLRKKLIAQRGELVAEVTSARPLSAAMQKQIGDALAKATGKDVQLELKEDVSVLGGVAIQLGSMRLDATLAGALNSMKRQLLGGAA